MLISRRITILIALVLTACTSKPAPSVDESEAASSTSAPPEPTATPSATSSVAELDWPALRQTEDPGRVLRFYASAIAVGDWTAAYRVWGENTDMSVDQIRNQFRQFGNPSLTFGEAEAEGAAGSSYYEVSVKLSANDGAEKQQGTVRMRRINDVDGSSASDRRWHIVSMTLDR